MRGTRFLKILACLVFILNAQAECLVEDFLRDGYCPGMGKDSAFQPRYEEDGIINRYGEYTFAPSYQTLPIGLTNSELVTIGAAAGTAILLFNNDEQLKQFAQEHRTEISEEISYWGEKAGSQVIGLSAAGYVLGVVMDNNEIKRVAKVALKATAISGIITRAGKMTFSRTRPNKTDDHLEFSGFNWDNDNVSFPSGHTTTAFAFATVIAEHYKDKSTIIPVLAYTAAAIGGWSRVHDNAHWASDVAIGALVGHLTGRLFYANEFNTNRNEKWDMSIHPVFTPDYVGFHFEFRGKKRKDDSAKRFNEKCMKFYEENPPLEDPTRLCFRHYLNAVYED